MTYLPALDGTDEISLDVTGSSEIGSDLSRLLVGTKLSSLVERTGLRKRVSLVVGTSTLLESCVLSGISGNRPGLGSDNGRPVMESNMFL